MRNASSIAALIDAAEAVPVPASASAVSQLFQSCSEEKPGFGGTEKGGAALFVFEVIHVDPLCHIGLHGCDTNIEVDHELSQSLTIDQNDLAVDRLSIIRCLLCEAGGRNEYAFFARSPCRAPTNF